MKAITRTTLLAGFSFLAIASSLSLAQTTAPAPGEASQTAAPGGETTGGDNSTPGATAQNGNAEGENARDGNAQAGDAQATAALGPEAKAALATLQQELAQAKNSDDITAAIAKAVKAGLGKALILSTAESAARTNPVVAQMSPATISQSIETAQLQQAAADQNAANAQAGEESTEDAPAPKALVGGSRTTSGSTVNSNSATTTDKVYN